MGTDTCSSSSFVEYCSAGFCSSGSNASPTPNAKRHVLQPGQIRQQLCSAGMVACPVQPKGYEVRLYLRLDLLEDMSLT